MKRPLRVGRTRCAAAVRFASKTEENTAMPDARVALVRTGDRFTGIRRALELIADDLHAIASARRILIKPNLVALNPHADTHVDAVAAVISFINDNFPGKDITVGEASATAFYNRLSTWEVYRRLGYDCLPRRFENVTLVDFDRGTDFETVPIRSVVGDTHLRIDARHRDFDCRISLSIPKTHNFAQATFGIKNMAGLVTPRDMATIHGMKGGVEVDAPRTLLDRLPPGTVSKARRALPNWLINLFFRSYPAYRRSVKMIHHNIVSFARPLWPDLVVLDGVVAMEGDGPCLGTPVDLGVVIASADPLKADCLAARVIGFDDPRELGYLHYLAEAGMGDAEPAGLVGDDWRGARRRFRRHGTYDIQAQWR